MITRYQLSRETLNGREVLIRRRPGSPPELVIGEKSLLRDFAPYIAVYAAITAYFQYHRWVVASHLGILPLVEDVAASMFLPELFILVYVVAKVVFRKNLITRTFRPLTPDEAAQLPRNPSMT